MNHHDIVGGNKILGCPGVPNGPRWSTPGAEVGSYYRMNTKMFRDPNWAMINPDPSRLVSGFSLSETIIIFCSWTTHGGQFDTPHLRPDTHNTGRPILYMDNHVSFNKTSFCGINEDNIYTYWAGQDKRRGVIPNIKSQPMDRLDSMLVNDLPEIKSK